MHGAFTNMHGNVRYVDVTVIEARQLLPMDPNGFFDFCVLFKNFEFKVDFP